MGNEKTSSPLFRNTVAYFLAGLAPNLINLVLLPLYTRQLGTEGFGQLALVVSFTAFLGAVLGLQLANSMARLYFDYSEEDRRAYISTTFFAGLVVSLLILLPLHAAGPVLAERIFPSVDIPYYPLLAQGFLLIFLQNQVNFGNAVLRVQQRGMMIFTATISHTLLTAGLGLWLVVYRGAGPSGLLWAMIYGTALHVLIFAFAIRTQLVFTFRWGMFKRAAAYSLPIIPHSFGGMLFMYSDKYVAALFVPVAAVGLYELADKISMVFKMAVMSFHHAISPVFMSESTRDREATVAMFAPLITRWAALYALLLVGMSLPLREIIMWIFPESFHASHVFIPILVGGYLFQGLYSFALDALLFEKKTKWIPWITFTAGACNVGANFLLLPRFGILAAAWTTLGAFMLCFLLAFGLARRVYPLVYQWAALARIGAATLATVFLGKVLEGMIEGLLILFTLKCLLVLGFAVYVWWSNEGGMRNWLLEMYRNKIQKRCA
ncbi:MAG: oligosaccharide flippase family protein [Kiritimatiellae bacterium]|jgi:O-antigen/teichoic acid export membrane protein|nr:oligosaccharide flippase family protein [Kiritimatiellia bacterium]